MPWTDARPTHMSGDACSDAMRCSQGEEDGAVMQKTNGRRQEESEPRVYMPPEQRIRPGYLSRARVLPPCMAMDIPFFGLPLPQLCRVLGLAWTLNMSDYQHTRVLGTGRLRR
jgi:hypothetical protein